MGQLSETIFGTATMSDVEMLAKHINALTSKTLSLTKAMTQHDEHESSFISAIDKIISNFVKEMKSTHEEINFLQNIVTNRTEELEHLHI